MVLVEVASQLFYGCSGGGITAICGGGLGGIITICGVGGGGITTISGGRSGDITTLWWWKCGITTICGGGLGGTTTLWCWGRRHHNFVVVELVASQLFVVVVMVASQLLVPSAVEPQIVDSSPMASQ